MILLESVPNISEGRDLARVSHWADWWRRREDVAILDHSSDPDHHRSVFTVAGEEAALVDALVGWSAEVLQGIDLTRHRGVHPRLGAVDVLPLVPLKGAKADDAVRAALTVAERLGRELGQPTYLYGWSAPYPERRRLADLRRGGLEGLTERAGAEDHWRPDFGPVEIEGQSGATAVGARDFLVAMNAVLDADDVTIARRIARQVRGSSGGMPGVQAIGLRLQSRRRAQVSMNLIDIREATVPGVVSEVERRAVEQGVAVEGVELIGLVPRAALAGVAPDAFGWSEDRLLEARVEQVMGRRLH